MPAALSSQNTAAQLIGQRVGGIGFAHQVDLVECIDETIATLPVARAEIHQRQILVHNADIAIERAGGF